MPDHVKPKNIMYRLCQVVVNWKRSHTFKKWCKFWSRSKL